MSGIAFQRWHYENWCLESTEMALRERCDRETAAEVAGGAAVAFDDDCLAGPGGCNHAVALEMSVETVAFGSA